MSERLGAIGAKVAPTMSTEQAAKWLDAVITALSDLPPLIALTAAKLALHRPMNFPNEVDGVVREIAAEISIRRTSAAQALDRLIADLRRAAEPALPAPETDTPLPPEQIEVVNNYLRRSGLRTRFAEDGSTFMDEAVADGIRSDYVPEQEAA